MISSLPLNAKPWSTKMKRALGAVVFSLGVALPQNGFLAIVSITDYYWSVSPAATLFFHVCNDALPPGIQLDFGKSQELVTPCHACQIWLCFPFFSWDESFGVQCYFVCEWMRLWVEKVRQWRRLKKKNVEEKIAFVQDCNPVSGRYWCIALTGTALLPFWLC